MIAMQGPGGVEHLIEQGPQQQHRKWVLTMKKRKRKLFDAPFQTTRSWLEADLPVLEAQERYASFLPLCLGLLVGASGGD
jgi:hypothetical protein